MTQWLSFEDAGKVIDGPGGWSSVDGRRPSAQSLLTLAARGDIPIGAKRAVYRLEDGEDCPADDRELKYFIRLWLVREKIGSDFAKAQIAPGMTSQIIFTLFDDSGGNFELTEVLEAPSGRYVTKRHALGLRFSAAAIEECFNGDISPAEVTLPIRRRGPRPKRLGEVMTAMIAFGDLQTLAEMSQEAMKEEFKASRETCRKARDAVLSELATNTSSNSDK